LPPDVHAVKAGKRTYYYHQKGRNTDKAGPRTALGSDPTDPKFWATLKKLVGESAAPAGSVKALIDAFACDDNPEWRIYEAGTKRDYRFYLDKVEAAWGPLPAAGVRPSHALALRDTLRDSPGSANHLISVGKALWKWAVPREYATINPFREIAALDDEDDGHWPWPAWAREHVVSHAPPDLARFVHLAVHTGQRESDVVRLGAGAREGAGLWVRPKKTKKRRRALWVPVPRAVAADLDRWEREPLVFVLERRIKPLPIPPGAAYVLSPAGNPYTPEGLRSRWNRWLRTDDGEALIKRWSAWMRARLERDGEDVAADATFKPTLHGLRSTAVVVRRMAGYTVQQISNDIGMSIPMVTRYSRFMDQKEAAENNVVILDLAREAAAPAAEPPAETRADPVDRPKRNT
jgi:integrase